MDFFISVELRNDLGKRNAFRLRAEKKVPAVIYFSGKSISISLDFLDCNKIIKDMSDGINLFTLMLNECKYFVVVKEIEKHPIKGQITHFGFQSVNLDDVVILNIPLKFINEKSSIGIKHGGFLIKHTNFIKLKCVVSDLPNFIVVDLSELNVNKSIFLFDLKIPSCIDLNYFKLNNKCNILVASIVGSRNIEQKKQELKSK